MFGKTQVKIESPGKKTRQGNSNRTKLAASSRNAKKKRYRGQGRWVHWAPLSPFFGSVSEWSKETVCKTAGWAYVGSNPTAPIQKSCEKHKTNPFRDPRGFAPQPKYL